MLPDLHRVDDVLPQDITAWTYARQGVEIGGSQPDGKSRVLLSQSLTSFLRPSKIVANEAAYGKRHDAKHQPQQGNDRKQPDGCLGVDDVLHRGACDNHQRAAPEIE